MVNPLENNRELGIDPHEILEKTRVRVRERFEKLLQENDECGCVECDIRVADDIVPELMKILDEESVI